MTIAELSKILGISESTLKSQFTREQRKLAEKGIIISKTGRGASADYTINYDETFNDQRAISIFEEETPLFLDSNVLRLEDWSLLTLIGVCMLPQLVFRGSYKDFLKYVCVKTSNENVEKLKEALENLNSDYIGYYPDKTDENYMTISLYRQAEKELNVPLERLKVCREIQIKNKNRSFIPILKVWMAVEKAIENQPYTIDDICNMTGLGRSTVKSITKELREEDIYMNKKNFIPALGISGGVTSTLNAFFD